MILRRISVGWMLILSLCFVMTLLLMPVKTMAVEQGPDWMDGQLTFEFVGNYQRGDYDEYTVSGNVLQQLVTGKKNVGSFANPRLIDQTFTAYPTSGGYMATGSALMLGEQKWQGIASWLYNNDLFYPNPTSSGMLAIANAYHKSPSPSELYYVTDWREMFNKFSLDTYGNVVRTTENFFTYNAYPHLKKPGGGTIAVRNIGAVSYSKNGQWAYALSDQGALRLSIPSLNYTIVEPLENYQYHLSTAVSNSGQFIVTGGHDHGLRLYDTLECSDSTHCARRELTDFARTEYAKTIPDKTIITFEIIGTKFQNESTIEVKAWARYADQSFNYFTFHIKVDPGPQTTRYLALGDSFSSGEGALNYRSVTDFYVDEGNYNLCHQSTVSYPYLLKSTLSPDWFGAVTCSGAKMKDVVFRETGNYWDNDPQAQGLLFSDNKTRIQSGFLPGYVDQQEFIKTYKPTLSTISIGGNDIGFQDIVKQCVVNKYITKGECYNNRYDREWLANIIDGKIQPLTNTFKALKNNLSGDQRLYVVGYPSIVAADDYRVCGLNVEMTPGERRFANNLVDYLNEAIRQAAANAGAKYVDVSTAFYDSDKDFRLCGGQVVTAVNGLTADAPGLNSLQFISNKKPDDPAYHESYHPNALGHVLLARRIRAMTNDLTTSMPTPPANATTKVGDNLRLQLVGDLQQSYTDQGQLRDDIAAKIATQDIPVNASFQTNATGLPAAPNSIAHLELHSTPISLGDVAIDPSGTTKTTITIPSSVPVGYHQLHIYYTDISGQRVDLYQYIYVVKSLTDYDGNGVPNSQEKCLLVPASGIDQDHDGIDDACDAEYVSAGQNQTPTTALTQQAVRSGAITAQEAKLILANETTQLQTRSTQNLDVGNPAQNRDAAEDTATILGKSSDNSIIGNKDNKYFLQKYIWYIVPVLLILLVLGVRRIIKRK